MNTTFAPVSVVIPIFGGLGTLARAIDSIVNQELIPQEVILVNDGGGHHMSSKLFDIAKTYTKGWIRIIHLPFNVGAGEARNAGWAAAQGKFVAFLDVDDAWHPQKIKLQYQFMVDHPQFFISGHDFRQESGPPSWGSYDLKSDHELVSPLKLLIVNQFITPSVMIKNSMQYQFSENKRYMEDFELWLTIALNGKQIAKMNAQLACIFKSPFGAAGLSANLWQMEKSEISVYFHACKIKPYLYPTLIFFIPFSLLKFFRRLLISFFD